MFQPLLLSLLLTSGTPDTAVVPMPEIVVSGSRVRESLMRTPAAVSVVNRSQFANGRAIGLDDVLSGIPGVLVQSRGGAQDVRITIRGYGARGNGERSNAGSMRGIRILSEGIPLSEPDGRTSLDLADVGAADVVEISRSNVSALYGNASGGVVNLRTDFGFDPAYRGWTTKDRTKPGHMGSPQFATPEKGEHLLSEFSAGVESFLRTVIVWDGRAWV